MTLLGRGRRFRLPRRSAGRGAESRPPSTLTGGVSRGTMNSRQRKKGPMGRVMADCRRWPSETNCSLVIIGEQDEVMRAAAEHAASAHGHEDTPELHQQL